MQLGTAIRKLTPPIPLRLAGYAARDAVFDAVREDIYLRIHIQQTESLRLVFIYADFLWWNPDFVKNARILLKQKFDFLAEHIFFVASHNHSGPPTGASFVPALETYDAAYAVFVLQQIEIGIASALADTAAVTLYRYDGTCDINIFRRKHVNGKIEMQPNYEVPADHQLTVLQYVQADGKVKGQWVHYPCHANVANGNELHPDYAGVALRMLDAQYGGVSLFLQGCTADLRPADITEDGRFGRGDYMRAQQFANDFYAACVKTLTQNGSFIATSPQTKQVLLKLPLENLKTMEELIKMAVDGKSDDVDCAWAKKVLERGNCCEKTLEINRILYDEHLVIFTLNAEVSQSYAQFAREICPQSICAAYTNGMIGYVCSAAEMDEGGYEPCESAKYFALPGTFAPACEALIEDGMRVAAIL